MREHSLKTSMLTADENIVTVSMTVEYRAADAKLYVLNVRDPESTMAHASESALRHVVGSAGLEQILTTGRDQVQALVKDRLQQYLDNYEVGIQVGQLKITNAAPPTAVQDAFDDVIKAREDQQRALFDQFAQALQEFMWYKGATKRIVRYVDDFLIVEGSKSECARSLQVALTTSTDSGFTVQHSKVTPPAKVIEFLGIIIDSQMGELRISEDRIVEVKGILAGWLDKRVGTKRSLLSLIGKLAFAARVVRTGRAFLGRLIALSKKAKYLHYKVRLSRQARADILWWHKCLVSHNGTCLYNVDWSTGHVIHVYTDASNIGFGGLCRGEWFALLYKGQSEYLATMSINWRELHAAIKAMASWAPNLAGKKIIFHIDNMVVCGILNKLYTAVAQNH